MFVVNELHQVNLSANINGTNQYSTEYNKKFPNPFREMENVVKTLAKHAIEAYPLIDNDTKSGLFLQEEQAIAAGGGSKSSIANNAITVNTNHDTPSLTTCGHRFRFQNLSERYHSASQLRCAMSHSSMDVKH